MSSQHATAPAQSVHCRSQLRLPASQAAVVSTTVVNAPGSVLRHGPPYGTTSSEQAGRQAAVPAVVQAASWFGNHQPDCGAGGTGGSSQRAESL